MGQIIVAVALSVDGFTEGPGGDISVMPLDESFNVHNAELIRGAARLAYGGTTYRQMVGYWPHVPGNADASDAEQQIARLMVDGLPILAVSDSLTVGDTGPWTDQTTIVRRADTREKFTALRKADGDTVIFGSRTLWSALLTEGLVDQLVLMIGPKLVAGDIPAFSGVPATGLTLLDVTRRPGSPAVVLRYAVSAS
ncbi:dihydrofolate reductase family protein [Actinomycetes bacterium M1A6_2h]